MSSQFSSVTALPIHWCEISWTSVDWLTPGAPVEQLPAKCDLVAFSSA